VCTTSVFDSAKQKNQWIVAMKNIELASKGTAKSSCAPQFNLKETVHLTLFSSPNSLISRLCTSLHVNKIFFGGSASPSFGLSADLRKPSFRNCSSYTNFRRSSASGFPL
jgi:hypothetical protein